MKIKYFTDTDTALVEFSSQQVAQTKEINENIYIDLDADGNLVNMTIEHASKQANIAEIAYQGGLIPVEIYSALIFVAVTTTMMFPIILKGVIKKDRTILTEDPAAEAKHAEEEAEKAKNREAQKNARESSKK